MKHQLSLLPLHRAPSHQFTIEWTVGLGLAQTDESLTFTQASHHRFHSDTLIIGDFQQRLFYSDSKLSSVDSWLALSADTWSGHNIT